MSTTGSSTGQSSSITAFCAALDRGSDIAQTPANHPGSSGENLLVFPVGEVSFSSDDFDDPENGSHPS